MKHLVTAAAIAAFVCGASAQMPDADTVKGADHPLLSRFAGSKLVGYSVKEYDAIELVAGKVGRVGGTTGFEKLLPLEGKVTRLAYNFPKERSGLEVARNYQEAMAKAGLKTLYSCEKKACGDSFGSRFHDRVGNQFIKGSIRYLEPFNYGRDESRYLLATGTRADGSVVHVGVLVVDSVQDKNGGVLIDVVESRTMETGKVSASLDADAMAKSIAAEGKVAVYGVYFDTGKAEVKPDSKAALDEMAKLLQAQPALKVYIVGHTDSQGTLAANTELSQRRADAVAKALETGYRIDGKRLLARGVASLAPVASNDAEPGREKNRRVELVKQ